MIKSEDESYSRGGDEAKQWGYSGSLDKRGERKKKK